MKFQQIPEDSKVAIISIAGKFRTGKSFLLDLFLRYLRYYSDHPEVAWEESDHPAWLPVGGEELEGNKDLGASEFVSREESKKTGFKWQAGDKRTTLGIWLWSHPFYLPLPGSTTGEKIAVLLMDTQGLYDMKSSQKLTTQIFGLSTLISSYQILNVERNIDENALSNVALFSEYAKVASLDIQRESDNSQQSTQSSKEVETIKPFQHIEFLVRDALGLTSSMMRDTQEALYDHLKEYIQEVMSQSEHEDLRVTREQITSCFDSISAYKLPHPGPHVAGEETFEGKIQEISKNFCRMVNRYANHVFSTNLQPKRIHGRNLRARDLAIYIESITEVFHSGDFPDPINIYDAVASANIASVKNNSLLQYKTAMNKLTNNCSKYVDPTDLSVAHESNVLMSINSYDTLSTFGRKNLIAAARSELMSDIDNEVQRYVATNNTLSPATRFHWAVFSVGLFVLFWFVRLVFDICWFDTCRRISVLVGVFQTFSLLAAVFSVWASGVAAVDRVKSLAYTACMLLSSTVPAVAAFAEPLKPKESAQQKPIRAAQEIVGSAQLAKTVMGGNGLVSSVVSGSNKFSAAQRSNQRNTIVIQETREVPSDVSEEEPEFHSEDDAEPFQIEEKYDPMAPVQNSALRHRKRRAD